jgi:chemotaxis protein methyltransferase CheR
MINCVTTNKTDFYREPHHFRFLQQQVIPTAQARNIGARRLRIWSAGCSTGEEPYTIALAVADALGPRLKSWDVRILASDIDTKVLETAAAGTYPADRIEVVPDHLRERYFSPSSSSPGAWDIDDSLRRMITFRRINFADPRWPINTQFDLIFCRNVIIYFDRDTQAVLFERFAQLLKKDGHLVIGHSETLSWLTGTFAQVRGVPTVYRLATAADGDLRPPSVVAAQAEATQAAAGADAPGVAPRPALVSPVRSADVAPPASRLARLESRLGPRPVKQPKVAADRRLAHGAIESAAHMPHTHIIHVGGVFASREPAVVRTILGSCVAACLYDPETRIGGMNHFLLPEGHDKEHDARESTRYGVHAMEVLINELMHRGADRRRLRAKAFGASEAIKHVVLSREVQLRNANFITQFLEVEGIPLERSLLGGPRPLEVLFATDSGRAFVRELALPSVERLAQDEDRYSQTLIHPATPAEDDDITLF